MADALPPLLVFSDDWGRHPSSCQHLIRHLLATRPVTWVNTIGTRAPSFNWATLRRGAAKLRQWFRPARNEQALPDNLRVLNPRMWPWCRSAFDRWMNRKLLTRQLATALKDLPAAPIAVTTVPIVADLIGHLPVKRWVYYCVDDFSQWPGLDQATMGRLERDLLNKVDRVIAVSESLQHRLANLGRTSTLLTHGIESDFWATSTAIPPILADMPRPLLVFFGLIDRRLDLNIIRRLGEMLPAGTILFVGPQADPNPALFSLPRVKVTPALPYEQLPGLAAAADVLIMPYADLPVTRAMQPLKLKEYLATGKPAVVSDLPANREWADCLDVAADPEKFARTAFERLQRGLPDEQRMARSRLRQETWSQKARQLNQWLDAADAGRCEDAARPVCRSAAMIHSS